MFTYFVKFSAYDRLTEFLFSCVVEFKGFTYPAEQVRQFVYKMYAWNNDIFVVYLDNWKSNG